MKRKEYVAPYVEIVHCGCAVQTLDPNSGAGEGSAVMLSWLLD